MISVRLKLGRIDEARREFERAAALTRNARERDLLHARTDRRYTGSRPRSIVGYFYGVKAR
jgi:predicted RNA polymerase sigma factor